MTRRRAFLVVLGAGAVGASTLPLRASAQAVTKLWRLGILNPRPRPPADERDNYTELIESMRDLGYIDGRNLVVQWRFANNDLERLPALASELVKERVDVIVTTGTPAVRAAQRATSTIPIVALSVGDPIESGFATSLARPGGNITGFTTLGSDVAVKRVELLTAIAAGPTRIAYLVNPDNAFIVQEVPRVESAVRNAGKELVIVNVRTADQLSGAFDVIVRKRAGALLVSDDSVLRYHRRRIGALALQHRLPVVTPWALGAENALATYSGVHAGGVGRRGATVVDKIFRGAKPGDLPFEQPTNFNLVINLKIAKALGITVPQAVLLQANRVLE